MTGISGPESNAEGLPAQPEGDDMDAGTDAAEGLTEPGGPPQDITGSGGITLPPLTPPKDDER